MTLSVPVAGRGSGGPMAQVEVDRAFAAYVRARQTHLLR
jgi:hypothetical protein